MVTNSATRQETATAPATSDLVDAVVLLCTPKDASTPSAADTRALAKSVLEEVARETGLNANASTVFENLHSFSVRAPQQFVNAIARLDTVRQVLPNVMSDSAVIEPVKRIPVKLPKGLT
jgi:hypothetical protein